MNIQSLLLIRGKLPLILFARCITTPRCASLSLMNANSQCALFDYIFTLWFVLQFDNHNLVLDVHSDHDYALVVWMNVVKYLISKCLR